MHFNIFFSERDDECPADTEKEPNARGIGEFASITETPGPSSNLPEIRDKEDAATNHTDDFLSTSGIILGWMYLKCRAHNLISIETISCYSLPFILQHSFMEVSGVMIPGV